MNSYIMTPAECRHAYRFPSNRANFATLEAFAAACGVDLSAASKSKPPPPTQPQAKRPAPPPPKAAPVPAYLAGDMTGEFTRALAEVSAANSHQPETPDMTNKQPPGEAEARRQWDRDPQLRNEFRDDFERYLAYATAMHEGRAKFVGNGGQARAQ